MAVKNRTSSSPKREGGGPPLGLAAVRAFEKAQRCRVPVDVRKLLLRGNGGLAPDVKLETRRVSFAGLGFLGIGTSSRRWELARVLSIYVRRGRIPAAYFPFAATLGGDLLLLGPRGVFFWDHEEEADDGGPPTTRNLTRVAASVAAFVARVEKSARAPASNERVRPVDFEQACARGDIESIEALLTRDGTLRRSKGKLRVGMRRAIQRGHVAVVTRLAAAAPPGADELRVAIINRQPEVVAAILACGVRPEAVAALEAATAGELASVKALLAAGAPVDEPCRLPRIPVTRTPLLAAAYGGHVDVARHLLALGADPAFENEQGHTPMRGASGRPSLLRAMRAAAAKATTTASKRRRRH